MCVSSATANKPAWLLFVQIRSLSARTPHDIGNWTAALLPDGDYFLSLDGQLASGDFEESEVVAFRVSKD